MSERLRQFERGQARLWVEARRGEWDHAGWLALLDDLRRGGWSDFDPAQVGAVVEKARAEYRNLRHWDDSGEAWRWVVARGGRWEHHDWMTLHAGLSCWLGPIDSDAALGELLKRYSRVHRAWREWAETGAAARWVAANEGHWNHAQWLTFRDEVRAAFAGLPDDLIGQTLEECKRAYWRLRHWEESGEPYRWVAERRGAWTHSEWLRLLASLERSAFWPMDAAAVGDVIERARRRYVNLREWRRSGAALRWVVQREGEWAPAEWLGLLAELRTGEGVDPLALSETLEDLREQYLGLRGWVERRAVEEERLMFPEQAAQLERRAA